MRPLRALLPEPLRAPLDLMPSSVPTAEVAAGVTRAELGESGEALASVALLAGCAQQVFRPSIGRATVSLLSKRGFDVYVPEGQSCCGALAMHGGEPEVALEAAIATAKALDPQGIDATRFDAVLTNAAGCGSAMAEWPWLFSRHGDSGDSGADGGGPEGAEAAGRVAEATLDVTTFLVEQLIAAQSENSEGSSEASFGELPQPRRVVYQDACHLLHAQRESSAPRKLLRSIAGATLINDEAEPVDRELCCGSAGTYNLDRPEIAAELGRRKIAALLEGDPDIIVTGNIGCLLQIESALRSADATVRVLHTVEFLAAASRGLDPLDVALAAL